jgi:hypothetical protein
MASLCEYINDLSPRPLQIYILPFFALATTYEQFSYHLHFLFDTGSPFTYLSYDVS